MKRRPLLAFTAMWVIGSGVASMWSGSRLMLVLAGMLMLVLVLCCLKEAGRGIMLCMLLSLSLGALYWEVHDAANVSQLSSNAAPGEEMVPITGTGTIASPVEIDGDRASFRVMLREADIGESAGSALAAADPQMDAGGDEAADVQGGGADTSGRSVKETVMVQVKLLSVDEVQVVRAWQRGDTIWLQGELQQPGEARNFDGFDYRAYLRTEKIHWIVRMNGVSQAEVAAPKSWRPGHILRWNDSIRQRLGDKLDQLYDGVHAGFMKGLVIGNRDDLDPETFREFSRLGLTHILAISGMHVAVVTGCLLFILSAMKLTRETSLTVAMWLLPLYVLLTGASPSVVRAGMMGVIGLYAAKRRLLKDGLNILSAAALIMLVWNPYYLLNVSFQLSFIVTAGLMIFVPMMMRLFSKLPAWLAGSASVTVVAQLVSFPLTIYYFNQFSLLSVAANLVLVPLISMVVLPLGMISLLLGWLWMEGAGWVARAAELINGLTFGIVEWMNAPLSFRTIWASPSFLWIVGYFGLLYGLLYLLKKRAEDLAPDSQSSDDTVPLLVPASRRGDTGATGYAPGTRGLAPPAGAGLPPVIGRLISSLMLGRFYAAGQLLERYGYRVLTMCCAGGLLLLLYSGYQSPSTHGAGVVQFLDVGQGDSILVSTPEGKFILIDGGGTLNFRKESDAWKERKDPFEVGKNVVVPLLKKRGVHQLEAVLATHFDQDHVGGLLAVIEEIPVKSIWINGTAADSSAFTAFMASAVSKRIPVYPGKAESGAWRIDKDTEVRFLAPSLPEGTGNHSLLPLIKEQNHASLVFEMEMSGGRFLFTGDTDAAAEQKLLLQQGRDRVMAKGPVDVMKVAHHGSKTSTSDAWLSAWRPKVSVISAGVNNRYGHPHPDVVHRLEESGTLIYQTNLHGEIQLRIKDGLFEARTRLTASDES
ncbi:ComEC/Rec2 family competence protein [Paenibacillus cisolokensis]|uniref:ComEC/Rec2 family competence protein n=1 Tax=Paenibacillus cisolokensis TaxID=1658519 RepID=UPI003D29E59E